MAADEAVILAFDNAMTQLQREMPRCQQLFNEKIQQIQLILSKLPGFLENWAKGKVNEMVVKFNAAMSKIRGYLDKVGKPRPLLAAKKVLQGTPYAEVSKRAPVFRTENGQANGLKGDDRWKGAAADAYRQVLNPQAIALDGYAGTSNGTAEALETAAWAIVAFVVGIVTGILAFCAALLVAALTVETVIGAVISIIAGILTLLGAIATGLALGYSTMSGAGTEFTTQANNNSSFGGDGSEGSLGHWPRAAYSLTYGGPRI